MQTINHKRSMTKMRIRMRMKRLGKGTIVYWRQRFRTLWNQKRMTKISTVRSAVKSRLVRSLVIYWAQPPKTNGCWECSLMRQIREDSSMLIVVPTSQTRRAKISNWMTNFEDWIQISRPNRFSTMVLRKLHQKELYWRSRKNS